ncbi:hypothetical protein DICVIV_01992 [Dictyocaulus viviparus]|uniref:Groucho/TLE N-terminal Q-rich domain-containing protein n=1 Tax=Dictyocaulus viviparus TaxID=29172 RepID=A0A0D8YB73_DICVI|nr:hypothetical protein DICVIV_01992 [Dictyocaulus viviparus]
MSFSCGEHLEAVRKEMTVLANQLQMSKQEVEKVKMETTNFQQQLSALSEQALQSQMEIVKNQEATKRLHHIISSYLPMLPPEYQAFALGELEKIRRDEAQSQQAQAAMLMGGMPNMMMARNPMIMAGMGMAGLSGGATASPRMTKPSGIPNGAQSGMSASVANGMAAAAAAAAGMTGMPPAMAAAMHIPHQQAAMLQAQMMMAAGMGMAMPGLPMPTGMGMPHTMNGVMPQMMPPMSVASGMFPNLTSQMNVSVSIPSRNPSNGALSAAHASATNSPRPAEPLTPQSSIAAPIAVAGSLKEERAQSPPPKPCAEENVSVTS